MLSLIEAWKYDESDKILHYLPLHHVHGLINKLLCMLYVGGTVEFVKSSNPVYLWKKLASFSPFQREETEPLTMFMAVPTIYARLLEVARTCRSHATVMTDDKTLSLDELNQALLTIESMRLMVSGSAALPAPVMKSWYDLTGKLLLERYGMTEIGMALSNPLNVVEAQHIRKEDVGKISTVGMPLPYVQVRLVNDSNEEVIGCNEAGELRVKVRMSSSVSIVRRNSSESSIRVRVFSKSI
jgi:malonyl-CoA/methylmalonyl-CoA synthetase